jgi:hypothetical protein
VPTGFPASVPVTPTSVPDRRLHDATRITDMVICRKVVFCAFHPPVVMLNLFQHEGQTSPVILKQPVVMLNLVQREGQPSLVILKQVQDDEGGKG